MRQRDQIEPASGTFAPKTPADHVFQFCRAEKLGDRQFADRDDKPRPQNFDLAIKPGRTICDFLRVRNPVASARSLAGKTTTDSSKVDFCTQRFLGESSCFLKPAEKRLSGGPGKWLVSDRFPHARRLPDQNDFTRNRTSGDGRRVHPGAAPTIPQPPNVAIKLCLDLYFRRHA